MEIVKHKGCTIALTLQHLSKIFVVRISVIGSSTFLWYDSSFLY